MASRRPLLINRDFTRLWFGCSVCQFGDMISDTALVLWVAVLLLNGKPEAPVITGAMTLTAILASLATAPVAGVLVDRWDCRRVVMCTDAIRGTTVLLLALALLSPPDRLGTDSRLTLGFAVLIVCSSAAQFCGPARVVLLSTLVPTQKLARASSYNQATYSLLGMAAPALAAVLVISVGMPATLLIDAASFLVSFLAIRLVRGAAASRPCKEPTISFGRKLAEGWHIVVRDPPVSVLLLVIGLVALGTGGMTTLMVYFVRDNLHASGTWFGILESALAVGALAGGLLAGRLADRLDRTLIYGAAVLALGLLVLCYAQLDSTTAALPTAVAIGATLGAANALFVPLLVDHVPQNGLGRVFSLINMTSQTATLLSIIVSTSLAGSLLASHYTISVFGLRWGPVAAIFTTAGVLCTLAGVVMLWHKTRRRSPPAKENAWPHAVQQR